MRCSQDALATKYSASAPLIEKPKWSSPLLTTHSPTTRSPGLRVVDAAPDLGDLARPLVARDDRVRDGDDVAALVELEVRVADADVARAHEHLVRGDRRARRRRGPRRVCGCSNTSAFIRVASSLVDQHLDLVRRCPMRAEAKASGASSSVHAARDDALDGQVACGDLRRDPVEVVDPVAPGADDREVVERPEHRLDRRLADEQARLRERAPPAERADGRRRSRSGARSTRSPRRRRARRSARAGTPGRRRPSGRAPSRPRAPRRAPGAPGSAPRRRPWRRRPSARRARRARRSARRPSRAPGRRGRRRRARRRTRRPPSARSARPAGASRPPGAGRSGTRRRSRARPSRPRRGRARRRPSSRTGAAARAGSRRSGRSRRAA